MKFLDIGEISRAASIPPSALRYYEEVGLIKSVARHGLRRQFEPETLLQLSLISLAKTAKFSLAEIAGMFAKDGLPHVSRARIKAKADDLDRQIRELTVLQKTLRHVAECPHPSHLACPRFRKLLRVATRSKTR